MYKREPISRGAMQSVQTTEMKEQFLTRRRRGTILPPTKTRKVPVEGPVQHQGDRTCKKGVERLERDFSEWTLAAAPQIGKDLGLSIGVLDEGLMAMLHENEDRRISEDENDEGSPWSHLTLIDSQGGQHSISC